MIILLSNEYVLKSYEIRERIKPTDYKILNRIFDNNFTTDDKKLIHSQLWSALDLSPLNKEFYLRIRDFFIELNNINASINNFELFNSKLLGRIIFLWFLKEKNYISKNYFIKESPGNQKDYYLSVLKNLFNQLDDKDFNNKSQLKVPYLGSTIFEISNYEFGIEQNIKFPENYFEELFNCLDSFNFTTNENTSDFEQVAIDPEMLGQIFENLLAEINTDTQKSARSLPGVLHPRHVVDFMCRNSLAINFENYFSKELNLIKIFNLLLEPFEKKYIQKTKEKNILIRKEDINKINTFLKNLKILDPACGSGAFPIGMLQVILRVYSRLNEDQSEQSLYDIKIHFLKNVLYGVDIDPIAIEISKLRALLTIIVESESNKITLPNLEFNYICANSLGILDKENISDNTSLFYDKNFEEKINNLRSKYFNLDLTKSEKNKLRKQFLKLVVQNEQLFEDRRISSLKSFNPFEPNNSALFFDSQIMFGIEKFDVVIGNPPYISFGLRDKTKLSKIEKDTYKKNYPNSAEYKIQIYPLFMEMGIKLLNPFGVNNFIVPDSFLIGKYFSKIRNFLLSQSDKLFFSIPQYDVFKAVVGFSVIYFSSKNIDKLNEGISYSKIIDQQDELDQNFNVYHQQNFNEFQSNKHQAFRIYKNDFEKEIIKKIEKDSVSMSEIFKARTGIRSKVGKKNIISNEIQTTNHKLGLTDGAQVTRLKIDHAESYIDVDPDKLWAGGWDSEIIEKPKILIRQTGDTLIAAIDESNLYHFNNLHSISPIEKNYDLNYFLVAYLNSKGNFYYQT